MSEPDGTGARRAADESLRMEEDRVAYLATCFALGEMDSSELREFYDLLRRPGDAGSRAAQTAWKVLGLTLDLRATLGTSFQDTVAHRVERGEGEFVGELKERLGLTRARLGEVSPPRATGRTRPIVRDLLAAGAAIAALVIVLASARRDEVASVAEVRGLAMVEGSALAPGMPLSRRPIVVPPGARVRLSWSAGHEARLEGPANAVPQTEGLSLSSGTAHVRSARQFTIGLPDRQVVCGKGARVSARALASRSALGVAEGRVLVRDHGPRGATELAAGSALAGDSPSFPWETEPRWRVEDGRMSLLADRRAACWFFRAVLKLAGPSDAIVLALRGPSDAAGARAGWELRLEPGALAVTVADEARRIALRGAPMLERTITIEAWPEEPVGVAVTGLEEPLRLPWGPPALEVGLFGRSELEAVAFHTGPPPPADAPPR